MKKEKAKDEFKNATHGKIHSRSGLRMHITLRR